MKKMANASFYRHKSNLLIETIGTQHVAKRISDARLI